MTNNLSSAPPIPNETFYDIEVEKSSHNINTSSFDPSLFTEINHNNQNNCNKTIILNRIIYLLLISSISFIIYDHNKIIGLYLSKIADIF